MSAENPMCEQGCVDRERNPPCCVKFCQPQFTYTHYEGCDIVAILSFLGPLAGVMACYITFCWSPTLKKQAGFAPMVGAPMMAAQY